MDAVVKILGTLITGSIGYFFYLKKRYRTAADQLKKKLLEGIEDYQSNETTLSAVVLRLYPQHNKAFEEFLIVVPKAKKVVLRKAWGVYSEIYNSFNQFGVFGTVVAEMPHKDFAGSPKHLDDVSRKRKKQVLKVLSEFINEL